MYKFLNVFKQLRILTNFLRISHPSNPNYSVLQALVALIHEPEPEHPLRSELAKEYLEERSKFMKNATEHTTKHASV